MQIKIRAKYSANTKHGIIRARKLVKNIPVEYSLNLFDLQKGMLKLNKTAFPNMDQAISYASLQGFQTHLWHIDQIEF